MREHAVDGEGLREGHTNRKGAVEKRNDVGGRGGRVEVRVKSALAQPVDQEGFDVTLPTRVEVACHRADGWIAQRTEHDLEEHGEGRGPLAHVPLEIHQLLAQVLQWGPQRARGYGGGAARAEKLPRVLGEGRE